ncbi:MAG: M23 family metallopeptidase [Bryobacteraceae bacterium]
MNQPYFIVVLAHSFHGRLRRVHIPYQFLWVVVAFALFGAVSMFGFVSSYVRMTWKVANYNNLRQEVATLRSRYKRLESESRQKGMQLASLQTLASEVSIAYGLKRLEGPTEIASEGHLIPTLSESLEQYDFLKSARLGRNSKRASPLFQSEMLPNIWPVDGRLMSSFGHRSDPFSGEDAFHAGVDISVAAGTPVKAAADGVVNSAEWGGGYGKLVIVDHASGLQTYYAHLSHLEVLAGQTVRRGDIVGNSGSTGKSTSPHVHYEVRRGGIPVNPHPYLKSTVAKAPARGEYGF